MILKQAKDMTRQELAEIPHRAWDQNIRCEQIILIPTRRFHDSGYFCMDVIAVGRDGFPICACAGGSDAINFEGIGGQGRFSTTGGDHYIPPASTGWEMDCLPASGYLRMWLAQSKENEILITAALSNLSIYSVKREEA